MSFIKSSEDQQTFTLKPVTAAKHTELQAKSTGEVRREGLFSYNFALTKVQERIMARMVRFWTPDLLETVLRKYVENHEDTPSIRTLDWSLINYAKTHHVVCTDKLSGERTNIHLAYERTLRYYRRRNFDAFRRRRRLVVHAPSGDFDSTISQLNFFAWAWASGVLEYTQDHRSEIERHMASVATLAKRSRRAETQQRRTELLKPLVQPVVIFEEGEEGEGEEDGEGEEE